MKTAASFLIRARCCSIWPALLAATFAASSALQAQAPKIPTKQPPLAEEVGPPAGESQLRVAPLPGLPLDKGFDSVGWIPQGPGLTKNGDLNIAPQYPTSGCVTAIAPKPSSTGTLYIGTANGGVWRTDNADQSNVRWKALTDDQLSLSIGGLAVDPSDLSGNTVVAGFGRRSSFGGVGGAQKGLIRTTDGGASWTRLGETELAGRSIFNVTARGDLMLLAVPETDNGTSPGLYRTVNGGANFTNLSGLAGSDLPDGPVTHLAADPSNDTRYYVHVASIGVYRSDDSGATWVNVSAGMAAANVPQLALAVSGNGTVFAAELADTSRVYRSTNLGANWTPMDSVQARTGGLFNGFVADPTNPNLVYLSGLFTRTNFPYSGRVVRGDASRAAGSQWTPIASTKVQGQGTAPHTDSRVLVFMSNSHLLEGDDGGIYELPVADTGSQGMPSAGKGSKWRSLNGNLANSEMHSMAYDRVSRILIGGAQDTGFQEQLEPGVAPGEMAGWDKTVNGDGGDALVDIDSSPGQSIRYGSGQNLGAFFRATYDPDNVQISRAFPALALIGDGTPITNQNVPFVTPLAMNAVRGGRLIIAGNAALYESKDQGETVRQIDSAAANQLAKIAYGGRFNGANVPDVLFYGSGSTVRYRTTAGGAFNSVPFPGGNVQGIVFNPENWRSAYVTGDTSVYRANNVAAKGAAGFVNITGNLTGVGTFHTLEYLTLPSGNALMVGTDLGAYIMRLASPAVWKTLGDNLPHAPVFDSYFDPAGQVLAVVAFGRGAWLYDLKSIKTAGQYGETFQAFTEDTSSLPSRVGELFSSHLGSVAKVIDPDLRELQLTASGVNSTRTVFRLPDLNPGKAVPAFSAKWNGTVYGSTANGLADGFSFNFGPLGGISGEAFSDFTYNTEDGFNKGLTVSVRTFSGNGPGYYVRVNGATVLGGFAPKPSGNWGNFNPKRHFFEVDWRFDTGLTLRVDGITIFKNLATPGFTPAKGDRFVFGARNGGMDEEVRLDNLALFTGGVLSRLPATAPYFFSDENGGGEGAEEAFDGQAGTKWLAFDYTGFIGASFPAPKTVRAYTLTSASDAPGRDPAAWEFQTGTGGTRWAPHGSQSAQFFENRVEQRAFVVAAPAAASKFRLQISENHGFPDLQLAEFQPWELTRVVRQSVEEGEGDSP